MISNGDYKKWKSNFEKLSNDEKLTNILNVIDQKVGNPCSEAANSVYTSMVSCVKRYIAESS